MYLSKLKLWNFRKFGAGADEIDISKPDLEVDFSSSLNVLIGENDSGKTAIIDSIKIILNTHSSEWVRLDREDFYNNTKRLRIECYFSGFTDDEAKNFIEWLGIKNIDEANSLYLKVFLDAKKNSEDNILPFDIKAGADEDGHSLPAEAREYLKTTYLKPLRDAKNELTPKRNSRLSQILQGHTVFKGKDNSHELVGIFKKFSKEIEDYFKDSVKEGSGVKKDLDLFLNEFFGEEKESEFTVTEQKLKNILETLRLTLEDGRLGLGSHNLLFIASELLNLDRKDFSIKLSLIEELEAHLCPQAQLRVIEHIQNKEGIQFMLTTHSPNMGSKVKLKNLIICENNNVFPMGTQYTKLDESDYLFLERFLDVTKANLFFAKGVILVEGWSEEILISSLAKAMEINLTKKGVSVVNVAGTSFAKYAKIFQRETEPMMHIPVSIVRDIDIKPDKYKEIKSDSETEQDVKMEDEIQKKSEYDGQTVKTFISPNWTLEYCLYKSITLGEIFQQIVKEIHSGTNFDNDFEKELCIKLSNGGLKKLDIAYRLAQKIESNPSIYKDGLANDDDTINYIIKAIRYASGANSDH